MEKLRIHYLQHVPYEGPGSIEKWALDKGHSLTATRFYNNDKLPDTDTFDWLIIMGGPMGVYDEEEHTWLKGEKRLIKKAIERDKTVIGICLGSQLIAEGLGAEVYPNREKEIGWFPVQKSDSPADAIFNSFPDKQVVFHWHGDTFDLPGGCTRLAETEVCKNQAFIFNNKVLGLQFHLEVTESSLKQMNENGKDELTRGDYIQTETEILEGSGYCTANQKLLSGLLDQLEKI